MSKSEYMKFSGSAFVAGAFAFLTILSSSESSGLPGSTISTLLLVAGMLSLRAHYGETPRGFNRNILLSGVIGAIVLYVGIAFLAVMNASGDIPAAWVESTDIWLLGYAGPAVVLFGLLSFGFVTLRDKTMAGLSLLSILAGIWYPVVYVFVLGYLFTHNGELPHEFFPGIELMILIQFLTLCVFGSVLLTTPTQEVEASRGNQLHQNE